MPISPETLPPGDHPPLEPTLRPRKYRHGPDITVEELTDGDPGYASEIEVVHPDELEEPDTGSERSDAEDQSQESDDKKDSDAAIIARLRRLRCQDARTARYEEQQEQQKDSFSSSGQKRTHSESLGTDTEAESVDALDDQDRKASARRLRRRVRGPSDHSSSFTLEDLHAAPLSDIGEQTGSGNEAAVSDPALYQSQGHTAAVPYWVLDPMDIDDSSQSPTATSVG